MTRGISLAKKKKKWQEESYKIIKYSPYFLVLIQYPNSERETHSLVSSQNLKVKATLSALVLHCFVQTQSLFIVLLRFLVLHSSSLTHSYKHNLFHSVSIKTKGKGLMAYCGLPRAHGELLLLLRGVTQASETARARGDWWEQERELRVLRCK